MSTDRAKNPTQEDLNIYLRKHRDFRGITERGLCVLVYDSRYGTTSVTVSGLTDEQRADIAKGRLGRLTKEELSDARTHQINLPRQQAASVHNLFE